MSTRPLRDVSSSSSYWQLGTMVKYPYLALTEMATVRSQALATVCVHSLPGLRASVRLQARHARRALSSAAHRVRAQSESHVASPD